jgi:predicted ATPase
VLKKFRVRGFKTLHEVDVDLAPLSVLFGPNATGKSNFLEALFLFSRLATSQTLGSAFDPPFRGYPVEAFSLPEAGLKGMLSDEERAELELEGDLAFTKGEGGREALLRYRARVRIFPKTGALEVQDEYLARLDRKGEPLKDPRIERGENKEGQPVLTVRRLAQGARPRFEPIGLHYTLLSNRQYSGEPYPDFDRLRDELSSWHTYYLDPRLAMREPQPPREVTDIGPRGEWLAPFLYRLKVTPDYRKNFQAVRRALHSAIPSIEDIDVDLDLQRGTLDLVVRQEGIEYSSRVISEGTLRVLALCCLAASPWPPRLLAFEEPENGVHPRRLEVVVQLLAGIAAGGRSQVVITTHSPRLAALLHERVRAGEDRIRLYRCSQRGAASSIQTFESVGPIFRESEIREALEGTEDVRGFEELMARGWLDG